MQPSYAELHCLSNFSFLRGASHPEELVARAKALGYSALALTDECSVAGVVRAHLAAEAYGLKLLIGSEFALADGPRGVRRSVRDHHARPPQRQEGRLSPDARRRGRACRALPGVVVA